MIEQDYEIGLDDLIEHYETTSYVDEHGRPLEPGDDLPPDPGIEGEDR